MNRYRSIAFVWLALALWCVGIAAQADSKKDEASVDLALDLAGHRFQDAVALIRHGTDVNAVGSDLTNPLIYEACGYYDRWYTYCDPRIARFLVDYGAHVNVTDVDFGRTPLIQLAYDRNADPNDLIRTADYLLAHGGNLRARESDGSSVLLDCAQNNQVDLFKHLAKRGFDPNDRDKGGDTALIDACELQPFYIGEQEGSIDIAVYLMNHGANVNAVDNDGDTALMALGQNGAEYQDLDVYLAGELLAHGARPGLRDKNGQTAYDIAKLGHVPKLAAYLLRAEKASKNAVPTIPGFTRRMADEGLQDAVIHNDVSGARSFLDRGANVNMWLARTLVFDKRRPLGYATYDDTFGTPDVNMPRYDLDMALLLLSRGARRYNVYDKSYGRDELHPKLLLSKGFEGQGYHEPALVALASVPEAYERSSLIIMRDAVRHGAGVNDRDPLGRTALQVAKSNHLTELCVYLRSVGGR